jgi:hypothetical protein
MSDVKTVSYAAEPSAMVDEFLKDAQALEAEKASLMERIDANRSILRNLRTAGKANKAQADAIGAFYKDRVKTAKTEDAPAADAPAAPATEKTPAKK